jgi:(E)-4-hydroxy-3-methylbut-2-enyl-diphosphate synthase
VSAVGGTQPLAFVSSPFAPLRRATRVVRVGDVAIGGANPIRVQSMTTTDTQDVAATADQAERLAGAGCEIVRITAPSNLDAQALGEIKRELLRRGCRVPLVADIHFTPNAAMIAAEHVEKVRVNPGNYADKKRFEVREYDDAAWRDEIDRVAARFRPLVRRCRELGRALRIGTNHGSLSDRILNRFGDTPLGMVESALEFLDVCEDEGFHDVVFSMKASNAQVAIQAYRLLAARLAARAADGRGPGDYPLHVGVTEAGDGEDGRVKSAIGIGALLEDGLGDTIRVSLTEDPLKEVPVARALAERYDRRWREPRASAAVPDPGAPFVLDPYDHVRRETRGLAVGGIELGAKHPVRVELALGPAPGDVEAAADALATSLALRTEIACEGLVVDLRDDRDAARLSSFAAALVRRGVRAPLSARVAPSLAAAAVASMAAARVIVALEPGASDDALAAAGRVVAAAGLALEWALDASAETIGSLTDRALAAADAVGVRTLLLSTRARPGDLAQRVVHATRVVAARLRAHGRDDVPIVLRAAEGDAQRGEALLLATATDLGALLCDGIGDAVSLALAPFGDAGRALDLGYRILQGARLRTSWTEFISCPSCGRTLFDLEQTTARIKARTQHLKGVKIAIMGCIVNGPGEMADADFGYVGSGPERVNLYVGKELVERNVPQAEADDRLVELIRKHGQWVDRA